MFKISALNESSSEAESDTEQNQVETKEAQEAHLLDLYNSALQHLVKNNKSKAKTNLLEITNSTLFQTGEGSEQIQKTLRYNVHKNLGECFMDESDFEKAEDHFFEASQIDRTDVTLWFKLASASVKLGNLHNMRGALEEGLNCSPNHWPCLENLIVVNFKLCDNYATLCYCAMALERDPSNQKAIEYKSKVYLEMPFLQEMMDDQKFVSIPVEREVYYYKKPEEPVRPLLEAPLESLTLQGVGEFFLALYEKVNNTYDMITFVNTSKVLEDFHTGAKQREEAKIKVSVQNLVEEMMDIIECGEKREDGGEICDTIIDEMLCDIFGVEPLTEEEKVVKELLLEMISDSVERGTVKKKSVILPPKTNKKKHFSIFDEIPEELLEKRRSCRNVASQPVSLAASTDTSCDVGVAKSATATQKELLAGFLPPTLISTTSSPAKTESTLPPPKPSPVSRSIFAPITTPWISPEEEAEMVTNFLSTNAGHPTELMRHYLDLMYLLDFTMPWSRELVGVVARIYQTWRSHWGYELEHDNYEEPLTMECLRYYIQGNECLLVVHQEEGAEEMDDFLKQQMWKDLNDLNLMVSYLPVELKVRIRSLRFHYYMLIGDEEEVSWETRYTSELYEEFPDAFVPHPITQYKMITSQFLNNYTSNLSKTKELEELNQYYDDGKYEEIVALLSETLDNNSIMTPSKDCSKTPDRESQIDIFIESLFYCKQYEKCMVWLEAAFNSELLKATTLTEEDAGDIKEVSKDEWDTLDTYLTTFEGCLQGLEIEKRNPDQFGQLPISSAARLAQNLLSVIARQIENPTSPEVCYSSPLPWILLHKLCVWQEKSLLPPTTPSDPDRPPSPDSCIDLDAELPGSLSLLCSAHNYLGQKAACTLEQGKLLNYLLDTFVPILTTQPLPDYSGQVKTALEQAVYCLYAHPSKKSKARHLTDHNVSQLGLTWPRAVVLYQYVKPEKLPEHDDVKTLSITADTENLLRRIVSLVPDSVQVEKRKQSAMDYLTGKTQKMRKLSKLKKLPKEVKDLFYLLADYTFKSNSDMENAIKYYAIDLTFNKERFDSWAALALAQGSKMDLKLNSCQLLVPQKMLIEIQSVEMCYKECLRINDKNSNLWIEFGNFCYSIHSFISRTLNNNAENLNFETFEKLEKKKEQFLMLALQNYEKTLAIFERDGIHENDVDERWLLLFMIGKIKEKQGVELILCFDFYLKSIGYLRKNEIVMPRKINYNNPQDFSIEALEVYYRIHASILKTVAKAEKEKKTISEETRRKFYEIIKTTQLDEIYSTNSRQLKMDRFSNKRKLAIIDDDKNKVTRQDETSTTIMRDVLEVVDTMIDDIEFCNDATKYSMDNLAKLCLSGLEDVVFHFFHHFKALYRMAHFYHTSNTFKNPAKVKKLLLAGLTDKSASFPGLFGGRKPNLIFNEVWRIPITEIDRPGSFANHCGKALILLLDVLKSIPDVATLVDISVQLRKQPSAENKFLHESDRQEIVIVANTYLNTALRTIREKMDIEKERKKPVETLEVYKLYQKLGKMWPGKEKDIFVHLRDMYAAIKNKEADKEKIVESEVLKFCSSETVRLRALANPRPQQSVVVPTQKVAGAAVASVVGPGGDKEAASSSLSSWQQWGQILADQQRMMQFQSLLSISSALPNMTPKDMAAFCGLVESDLSGLAAYTSNISSLSPSSLASMGITSSQLSSLAQIASLTGANPATISGQAAKQAQFEQEYLRHLIGGGKSQAASSMTTTSTQQKASITQKATITQKTNQTPKQGQKVIPGSIPVKQTVQFKSKQQQQQQLIQKKNLTKVVGLSSKPSSPTLNSVAHKLSSSGVTISKPATTPIQTASRPISSIPKAQARNTPSPVVRSSLPQGISIIKQPKNPNLSKKFPHLNITSVDQTPNSTLQAKSSMTASVSPKPGLTVKPSSQLLKPAAAMAGMSQAQKTQNLKNADAKNKLALFKAQMKKTLNIPGGSKKSPLPTAGPSRQAVSVPKQNNAAAAKKKPPQPKPKPSGEDCEVICIDID